jgi:formylmethanofuran dehydrogenase subunit D
MPRLKKVLYGTLKIQKLRRIALDPNLLDTLGLQEGDSVKVELDVGTSTILIRKNAGALGHATGGKDAAA